MATPIQAVTLWGDEAPTHSITAILIAEDQATLVTGSQEGQICLWHLSPELKFQGQRVVCCMCADHSVMLLHLQGRACILQARKHFFPVKILRWHPVENLLIIGCENNSIYIWDIETGVLERYETGAIARIILACCEESVEESMLPLVKKDTQKHKNTAGQTASSYGSGNFPCSSFTPQEQHLQSTTCHLQCPLAILPVRIKPEDPLFHVLLFDVEKLAELLPCSAQPSGPESPGVFQGSGSPKRSKSTIEKRTTLMLKRSWTSGSLLPLTGQGKTCVEEQEPGEEKGFGSSERSRGIRRHKKAKCSKPVQRQPSGRINPGVAVDVANLLLSCLLPWGMDRELDEACVQQLGMLRLAQPISLGLVSRDGRHLSLTLPGPSSHRPCEGVNLLSHKVPGLCRRYISVAEGQAGSMDGCRERSLTPPYLLGRMCLVQKIIGRPLGKASPQEVQPTHSRGKLTRACEAPAADCTFGSLDRESQNCLLVRLISSWREQSVEVAEALQAVLLAEVQCSIRNRPGAVGSICEPILACGEAPKTEHPGTTESQPSHDEAKPPHPWISKVCSCKVC